MTIDQQTPAEQVEAEQLPAEEPEAGQPDAGQFDAGQFDAEAANAFAARMLGILNDGAIALLTSTGHQTGLFDTLAGLPPATSEQIADASGLHERYVREWLGGMTAARVIRYQPEAGTYLLPHEHAALLTRAAGPQNVAVLTQGIPLMGEVEQKIIERFRHGGGLSYADYPRFHRYMAEVSAVMHDAGLLEIILPLAAGLPERLHSGVDVADIGCGSGHAVNVMAQAFPTSRFTGYDFSEEGISAARAEAERLGLTNAAFEILDVAALNVADGFDAVTAFDAIHDQAHPAAVLRNIQRALRPAGTFLMVDFKASSKVEENIEIPWGSYLYAISTFHCMSVSLGLDGDGLGTAWGKQLALSMLADAGFNNIEVKDVDSDPFNNYFIATK